MGFETEPLGFQWQGATAREGIMEGGKPVPVEELPGTRMVRVRGAGPPPALPDLGPCPVQHLFVGGVLPENQLFQNLEQALAFELRRHRFKGRLRLRERRIARVLARRGSFRLVFGQPPFERPLRGALLLRVGKQHVHVLGRVVDHLGEDHRPSCGQRPSCPPQVQRARVPVPDRLLPRRRPIDGVERQGDLDQFL